MNAIQQTQSSLTPTRTLAGDCLASCQKLLAQIERTKVLIVTEFREALADQDHLLRLALNEAEALAWQTGFPQLVFPTLAREKVQAVASWRTRQRSLN